MSLNGEQGTPIINGLCSVSLILFPSVDGLILKSKQKASVAQDKQDSDTVHYKGKPCKEEKKPASRVFRGQDVLKVNVEM